MWEKVWWQHGLPGYATLDMIDAEVERSEGRTIRRSWLRELADGDDPVTFLVATTIWGYGGFGRGVKALGAMLSCDALADVVTDIVDASRLGAAPGFRALFDARGHTRIPWLGIAYGTKVVHFAGYRHADPPPLILDKRVFLGAAALDGNLPVPDPGGYTATDDYANYCTWAADVAGRNGVEPHVIEYTLFAHGGKVRASPRAAR